MAAERKETDLEVLRSTQSSNPNVMFIIERSKNKNIVVYEGHVKKGVINEAKPIEVYWHDIDPQYIEAARAKGKTDPFNRNELNYIEKTMAYGATATKKDNAEYKLELVALPKAECTMFVDPNTGNPRTRMVINGKECVLLKMFVHAVDRWVGLPKVEYVLVIGEALDGSGTVAEKKVP